MQKLSSKHRFRFYLHSSREDKHCYRVLRYCYQIWIFGPTSLENLQRWFGVSISYNLLCSPVSRCLENTQLNLSLYYSSRLLVFLRSRRPRECENPLVCCLHLCKIHSLLRLSSCLDVIYSLASGANTIKYFDKFLNMQGEIRIADD